MATKPPTCQVCSAATALWAWQPFGPGEAPGGFVLPGNHYRGFPVVPACDACKQAIQAGEHREFTCHGMRYSVESRQVFAALQSR